MKNHFLSLLFVLLSFPVFAQNDSTFTVTFFIKDIPKETPHDASFYLAGSFNDWNTNLAINQFQKIADGRLMLSLEVVNDTFEYKITRGTWASVEGQANGRARDNRQYIASVHGKQVKLTVESWEDISKGSYLFFMYTLLLAAFQGLILIFAIYAIGNKANNANQALIAWVAVLLLAILGRASTYEPEIFNWQPKLILLPEMLLFSCAPLFYRFVQKLLGLSFAKPSYQWLIYLPLVLQIGIYVPICVMEKEAFRFMILDHKLNSYFATFGAMGFLFNGGFWIYIKWSLTKLTSQQMTKQVQKDVNVISALLNILLLFIAMWLAILILGAIDHFAAQDLGPWVHFSLDTFWFVFSLIFFMLSYILVKDPDVVKHKVSYQNTELDAKEMSPILTRLKTLLEVDQVFTNPVLTLNDLAHQIPTSSHMLSRVINENYKKSFSGLVNQYRIEAFIDQMNSEDADSYLTAAFAVGFNSKATFNRAFKKETNQTPRAYFESVKK